ncbi:MAG: T9SS type A sorting domain-containing protein [Bacteroidales bacterium]|nr:T9SS type A sorting domain-containing protein [Bacteroidales bacterium]
MKQLITIILLISCVFTALSQESEIFLKLKQLDEKYSRNAQYCVSDSIVTYQFETKLDSSRLHRTYMEYNSRGSIMVYESQNWKSYGYNTYFKAKYLRDDNDNFIGYILSRKENSAELSPYQKYIFKEDESQNIIQTEEHQWNKNLNDWHKTYQSDYVYKNNHISTKTERIWNAEYGYWEIIKTCYTYINEQIDLSLSYKQSPQGSDWKYNLKTFYTYDIHSNLILRTTQNFPENNWENQNQYKYSYDQNNYLNWEEFSNWNTDTQEWEKIFQNEFKNDDSGNQLEVVYLNWNNSSQKWFNSTMWSYQYYENGLIKKTNVFEWNTHIEDWQLYCQSHMILNSNDEYFCEISSIWDKYNQTLKLDRKSYYHYHELSTLNEFEYKKQLLLYPNPGNGKFKTDITLKPSDRILVYSLDGRLIKSILPTEYSQQINLSSLKNGMYILSIQTKQGHYSEKIQIIK